MGWYESEIGKDGFKELIDNFIRFNHETGHFTILIWKKTTHLGSAIAFDRPNHRKFTMHKRCDNFPQDNMYETPMLTKSPPCSKRPSGTSCNSEYISLCGEIDNKDIHFRQKPYRKVDKAEGKITEDVKSKRKSSCLLCSYKQYCLL